MAEEKQSFVKDQKKLWKDHYSVKKPHCPTCLQQGISQTDYNFCSVAKKPPQPIRVFQEWDRTYRLVDTFNNIYKCNVYHWIIYQGQGKINSNIFQKE